MFYEDRNDDDVGFLDVQRKSSQEISTTTTKSFHKVEWFIVMRER